MIQIKGQPELYVKVVIMSSRRIVRQRLLPLSENDDGKGRQKCSCVCHLSLLCLYHFPEFLIFSLRPKRIGHRFDRQLSPLPHCGILPLTVQLQNFRIDTHSQSKLITGVTYGKSFAEKLTGSLCRDNVTCQRLLRSPHKSVGIFPKSYIKEHVLIKAIKRMCLKLY